MIVQLLLGTVFVLGVSTLVLYLKLKGHEAAPLKAETDQRVASELAAIKAEMDRRQEDSKRVTKDVKEAIALRNAILASLADRELRSDD